MLSSLTRRGLLSGTSALGLASLVGSRVALGDDSPAETSVVRFTNAPAVCIAPQYVAQELLRAEGFDVQLMPVEAGLASAAHLGDGKSDFMVDFATALIMPIDRGVPLRILSGVHVGCYELFAQEGIRSVVDLKGRSVGAGYNLQSDPHIFVSAMASYVGLDPRTDIDWVTSEARPLDLFREGKIDAFLSFPPEAQQLRAQNVGHVIVNSMVDRPWSQYFCCVLAGNAEFVQAHPATTKRVVRAILKGADLCASQPGDVARMLVDRGYTPDIDYALQALREIPYKPWREFDPEDTVRFFALRLREAGMIESNPQKIIAAGTDWRFANELRQELKS